MRDGARSKMSCSSRTTLGGGAHLVSVSAIGSVPGPPDCSSPTVDADNRFAQITAATGGVFLEACDPDAATAMQQLRAQFEAMLRRFRLQGTPNTSAPMTVLVNGAALPPTEWTYRADINSVEFATTPPPGAAIEITYIPDCG